MIIKFHIILYNSPKLQKKAVKLTIQRKKKTTFEQKK